MRGQVGRIAREAHGPPRRFVAVASAVLFVVAALGGCSVLRQPSRKPATAYPRCPEATRWVTGNVTGTQGASSSAGSNETWNLTGFTHTTTPDPTRYPFRLERVRNVCIVGGRIIGNIPDSYSRTQWYDGIGLPSSAPKYDGDAFRIVQKNGWALIRDAYVERVSDAYNPQGPRTARFYLDHVHAKDIRDDCIENDLKPHSIYVKDSLFDGCHNFISERGEDSSYGRRCWVRSTATTTIAASTTAARGDCSNGRAPRPGTWSCGTPSFDSTRGHIRATTATSSPRARTRT